MNHHALRSAVALYRGGTYTLEQAARHAGVSSTRMEAALRRHGVSLRLETAGRTTDGRIDAAPGDPVTGSANAD